MQIINDLYEEYLKINKMESKHEINPQSRLEKELSNNVLYHIKNNANKDTIVNSYELYSGIIRNLKVLNQPYDKKLFFNVKNRYYKWFQGNLKNKN